MSNVGAQRYLILRPETTWGEYDSGGSDVLVPFWDDGFNLRPRNVFTSQLHVTGVRGDTHRANTARDFAGAMQVGFWPELVKTLLDFATVVDANGDLASYSMTIVDPNIETMRYYGVRVNTLALRISEGEPTLLGSMDLIAKYGNAVSAPSLPSYPADQSFVLQDGAVLLDVGDGNGYIDRATIQSVELTIENNLRPGRHVRDADADKNKTISSLRTGTQRIRGSIEVEHEDSTITDALLAVAQGSLELLFSHPGGNVLTVGSGGASAGSAVPIPVTTDPTTGPAFDVADNEHVFLETGVGTGSDDPNQRSVARVTALATGPDTVTVAVLDRDVSENDKIYGEAMRIRVGGLDMLNADPSGGREDNRNQTLEFEGVDDGTGVQFAYAVQDE